MTTLEGASQTLPEWKQLLAAVENWYQILSGCIKLKVNFLLAKKLQSFHLVDCPIVLQEKDCKLCVCNWEKTCRFVCNFLVAFSHWWFLCSNFLWHPPHLWFLCCNFSVAFSYLQYLSQVKWLTNNQNSYKYRGIAVVVHMPCIEFRECIKSKVWFRWPAFV